MPTRSFRHRLRAFQLMRGQPPERGIIAKLEYLENRDLDLSVRLGGMLAFNALMITIGMHPIASSTGAPLNLDVATQPWPVVASLIGVAPLYWCLRALLIGEEFDTDGSGADAALRQRLFAAFVHSIDQQSRLLRHAVRATLAGGVATLIVWAWIIGAKMG